MDIKFLFLFPIITNSPAGVVKKSLTKCFSISSKSSSIPLSPLLCNFDSPKNKDFFVESIND
jgi:hypothetical protein